MPVATFTTSMFTLALHRLFGLLAVIPAVGILMFVGVPASNGAMSMYMTPQIFKFLHGVLPMPAAVESVRSILYFGGDAVGSHLVTFVIWGLLHGLALAGHRYLHERRGVAMDRPLVPGRAWRWLSIAVNAQSK